MKGRRGPAIAGAAGLVLVIIMFMILVLPKMQEVSDAKIALQAAAGQEQTLRSQLAALEQARDASDANQAIIDQVARQIPPTVDEPGLLLLLANAASRAGLPLTQFTPGNPVLNATTQLSEVPVTFTVTGTYFSLAQFLFNLETLPRVAKVQGATVTGNAQEATAGIPSLQMDGSVILYTTDANAGPGSQPGPTSADGSIPAPPPSLPPSVSPSAEATPSPESPTPGG